MRPSSSAHPMKVEHYDLHQNINIDPKGHHRAVDDWWSSEHSLYMARPADHPEFGYLESWLIPSLDLRVSKFHFREGIKPTQELYIDLAHIKVENQHIWTSTDLYIDVVTHTGGRWEVLDLDEFGDALSAGYLPLDLADRALHSMQKLCNGIITHGSAEGWLESEGIRPSWAQKVTLAPAAAE